MCEKRIVRTPLAPFQTYPIVILGERTKNEVIKERRDLADDVSDRPVARQCRSLKLVEERGEIAGIAPEIEVVVQAADLLDGRGIARVMKVVDLPAPHAA